MDTPIKFYYDLMSQPSRAIYIVFKLNKIPAEYNPVALRKSEHLAPKFKEINRFKKVPCIVDNGLKLSESVAILYYLDGKGLISDQWYPKQLQQRAKTDEYLEWHHNNTRIACDTYFEVKWLHPLMTGKEPNPKKLDQSREHMEKILDLIENVWLEENKFLAGDRISIADIVAASEIEETKVALYDPVGGRPRMEVWMEAVRSATNPYYDEAHKIVVKTIAANKI